MKINYYILYYKYIIQKYILYILRIKFYNLLIIIHPDLNSKIAI